MVTPTVTPYPLPIPAKNQPQTVFDGNVNSYMQWLSTKNAPELIILIPWMEMILNEVAATAMSGDLPNISGRSTQYVRVNSAETAMEFRTQAQTLQDIGAKAQLDLKAPIASPVFSGSPRAPSPGNAENSSRLATTSFVQSVVNAIPDPVEHVKAWVNFRTASTNLIFDDFNVSTIGDNGVGDFTVNFSTSMANTRYAVSGMTNSNNTGSPLVSMTIRSLTAGSAPTLKNTNSVRINTTSGGNASKTDFNDISVVITGA